VLLLETLRVTVLFLKHKQESILGCGPDHSFLIRFQICPKTTKACCFTLFFEILSFAMSVAGMQVKSRELRTWARSLRFVFNVFVRIVIGRLTSLDSRNDINCFQKYRNHCSKHYLTTHRITNILECLLRSVETCQQILKVEIGCSCSKFSGPFEALPSILFFF